MTPNVQDMNDVMLQIDKFHSLNMQLSFDTTQPTFRQNCNRLSNYVSNWKSLSRLDFKATVTFYLFWKVPLFSYLKNSWAQKIECNPLGPWLPSHKHAKGQRNYASVNSQRSYIFCNVICGLLLHLLGWSFAQVSQQKNELRRFWRGNHGTPNHFDLSD